MSATRQRVSHRDPSHERFALRDALVFGANAETRASAAAQLDATAACALAPYLRDALLDASSTVREAAFDALARAADARALDEALRAVRWDRSWRVRRAAARFAARVGGDRALRVLEHATEDPFWRVRVTARRVAAAMDPCIIVNASTGERAGLAEEDPDPAVIVARLSRDPSPDLHTLIHHLGHPHDALRRLARRRLAEAAPPTILADAAARWLHDERLPYGPATCERMLAATGPRTHEAAAILIDRGAEPGALAWAIRNVHRSPSWPALCGHAASDDPRLRRACLERASEVAPSKSALTALLAGHLADEDPATRALAALVLQGLGRAGRDVLLAMPATEHPTPVLELLVDAAAAARDVARLHELVACEHALVRGRALAALSTLDQLDPVSRRAVEGDEDPWVRAALDRSGSEDEDPQAHLLAMRDARPGVRRVAIEALERLDAPAALRAIAADANAKREVRRAALHFLVRNLDALAREELDVVETALDEGDPLRAHLAALRSAIDGHAPPVAVEHASPAPPRLLRRDLGRTGLSIAPLGLSGVHLLEARDVAVARERGVNLFFWEPRHLALTRFLRADTREDRVVVAGTYHADAPSIEADVARAMKQLRAPHLDVFLAFWARSRARLDEIEPVFERLRREGRVRAIGISTHDRVLAVEAAERGFDVVMIRHSAAHRGAESAVFPRCRALGVGVLTFSNVCYGRMLAHTDVPLSAQITAADCYRYSIAQPGVHACIAAPRRRRELVDDLAVLEAPSLAADRLTEMRAHGNAVYARSKSWRAESWGVSAEPLVSFEEVATAEEPEAIGDAAPRGISELLSHAVRTS